MEASSDQVQLQGGGEFWGGGQTWDPSGSEVWGWQACKLANKASQTQTLRVQGQRERPHLEGGPSLCRVHWNIQVFLHCWATATDLLSACVRKRWEENSRTIFLMLSCKCLVGYTFLWLFIRFPQYKSHIIFPFFFYQIQTVCSGPVARPCGWCGRRVRTICCPACWLTQQPQTWACAWTTAPPCRQGWTTQFTGTVVFLSKSFTPALMPTMSAQPKSAEWRGLPKPFPSTSFRVSPLGC